MIDPAQQIADKALIERVSRGDQLAFSDLYDRLSQPLFSMILQMLGDRAEAEDALQDATLQIWRRAPTYNPAQSSVFSWAVMLTRSRVIDRLRARGRRARLISDAEPNEEAAGSVASEAENAAESLTKSDEAARARAALLKLPRDQRQAIELAFFSEMTHLQIAEQSGEPLGTVKARIRRGLLKMRDNLR
jgi:RNA polymerase sigma-70 factor (ECF subfamily)